MAGISAGKKLYDAGYRNFQILEATDRIGGRMRHGRIDDVTVEVGAMWIYGMGSNPVYELALNYNLSVTDNYADDWTVINYAGENVTDEADAAYEKLETVLSDLYAYAQTEQDDVTVRAGIRHLGWRPQNVVEETIEVCMLDFETAVEPIALSAKHVAMDEIYQDFGDDTMLIVDDPRGFSYVVNRHFESINDTNDRLLLNKTVEKIAYSNSGVEVTIKGGKKLFADYVIVTFSLGVLQQRMVQFSPPLPEAKQMAIDKFGMADFSHIYVRYLKPFWDDTMYLMFAPKARGKFSVWVNMNSYVPECNIIQVSLFNEYSRWADRSTDDEILAEIKSTFQQMYPNSTIPDPIGYKFSRWNSETHYRGAYTYWPPTFTENDMDMLGANVGRVYFAGEHTHPTHYGFVHGALITGESSAEDLIKCIEDSSTC